MGNRTYEVVASSRELLEIFGGHGVGLLLTQPADRIVGWPKGLISRDAAEAMLIVLTSARGYLVSRKELGMCVKHLVST